MSPKDREMHISHHRSPHIHVPTTCRFDYGWYALLALQAHKAYTAIHVCVPKHIHRVSAKHNCWFAYAASVYKKKYFVLVHVPHSSSVSPSSSLHSSLLHFCSAEANPAGETCTCWTSSSLSSYEFHMSLKNHNYMYNS